MMSFKNTTFTGKLNRASVVLFSLLLNACGGSSGKIANSNPIPTDTDSIIMVDNTVNVKQATELVIQGNNISDVQWQQTSGEPLIFLADNTKVISFTPSQSGDYGFSVSYKQNNEIKQLDYQFTVQSTQQQVTARLGHAVLAGNGVSLRAWSTNNQTLNNINWQQIQGPSVTLNNSSWQDPVIFFDAPNVNQDTLLVFKVTADVAGETSSDLVAVLVEYAPAIANNAYFDDRKARVFPYDENSPYADALLNCVYNNTLSSSCTLGELPLIAQQTTTPSVDDIMSRVLVSHRWMGDRFKDFLTQYDLHDDFKRLLRATTAIVIAYDVRPSFYWAATGAIYLDADNFWLTPDERDTINEAPDYRSAFGQELQFVMPWRYVKNNQYASNYFADDTRITRPLSSTVNRLSSLLYHELAHANDFFPSTEWFDHSSNERILDAAISTTFESDDLAVLYPLSSDIMRNLAQVSFQGETATAVQKAYLPEDVALEFKVDHANDYYNYSSLREDYAMLFEELMMYSRLSVQRDVAVTNRPTGTPVYANDYIVTWGQRGRVGENTIKTRAQFVAQRVLPEFDATNAISNLPNPIEMQPGADWIQNLILNEPKQPTSKTSSADWQTKQLMRDINSYYHKPLPKR
jgi:hypothetical protein